MQEAIEIVEGHRHSTGQPFEDGFETLRRRAGVSVSEFLDAVAHHVAHEYAAGRLPYSVADDIANHLAGIAYTPDPVTGEIDIPDYMWSVYLAFDAGEYLRSDDSQETDVEEKYTRPAIAAIIARENAA